MAIEPVQKTTLLVPRAQLEPLLAWLYERAEFALEEFAELAEGTQADLRPNRLDEQLAAVEDRLAKAGQVLEAASRFAQEEASFVDRLLPLKAVLAPDQMARLLERFNLESLAEEAAELERRRSQAARRLRELTAQRDELLPLSALAVPLSELRGLSRLRFRLVRISPIAWERAQADEQVQELLALERLAPSGETVVAAAFWRPADDAAVEELLARLGFQEHPAPPTAAAPREELARLEREITQAQEALAAVERDYRAFAAHREEALVVHGYLESEHRRVEEVARTRSSQRVALITGWALERNSPALRAALARDFPGVEMVVEPPAPGEPAPVRLTNHPLTRPPRLLVEMFGLPEYRTFDPTPCLMLPFLVFFGLCFGDVLYGLWLTLLAWYLRRRYRDQRRLAPALNLFVYAGLSTMLFGALTGAWASDLYRPEYLGAGNPLGRIASRLQVLDMLANPVLALTLVLAIGVANQFWAIMLAFWREARRGDWFAAVVDSAAWLVFFSGLLLLVVNRSAALVLLAISGAALVLFQGRHERSLAGRIVGGFVSLYGIVGTYGVTAFVGDVVSYSRLMALGLTTSIIGSAVNIIAGLARETPYIGWPLFGLVLLGGHLFNFFVSVLGAFVHSARLILLEFFGRFYRGGARPFEPYGFRSDKLDILPAA